MNPKELASIHSELQRLIYSEGQTIVIRSLLRVRFLNLVRREFPRAWLSFGYDVANELLSDLPQSIFALNSEQLRQTREALEFASGQPARSPIPNNTWKESCESVGKLCVEATPRYSADFETRDQIAVPVIYETKGDTNFTVFQGLRASGCQWLSIRFDQVFPLRQMFAWRKMPKVEESEHVTGNIGAATRRNLNRILADLDVLAPWSRARRSPDMGTVVARCTMEPSIRLRGLSAGLPFLLQCSITRLSVTPSLTTLTWDGTYAATGELVGETVKRIQGVEEKVGACLRERVSTLFVPKSQVTEFVRAVAKLRCSSDSLEIVGVGDLPNLRLSSRAGVHSRSETLEEAPPAVRTKGTRRTLMQTASSLWIWYFLSQTRAIATLVFMIVLAIPASAVLWPIPTSIEGRDQLTLRNRLGIRVASVKPEFNLQKGLLSVGTDELLATRIPTNSMLPQFVGLFASSAKNSDVVSLVNWRGQRIWSLKANQVLSPQSPLEDMRWRPFFLRGSEPQSSRILLIARHVPGSLTLVTLFRARADRLERTATLGHRGHLERFPVFDFGGDSTREQIAMGWTGSLSNETILAANGLPLSPDSLDSRGRSVLYVIDFGQMESPEIASDLESLIDMTTEQSLQRGVQSGWAFPKDRFSRQAASTARDIRQTEPGSFWLSCDGASPSKCVEFKFRVSSDQTLTVEDVQFTSSYQDQIREWGGTYEEIEQERERLRKNVARLTASGWQLLP